MFRQLVYKCHNQVSISSVTGPLEDNVEIKPMSMTLELTDSLESDFKINQTVDMGFSQL